MRKRLTILGLAALAAAAAVVAISSTNRDGSETNAVVAASTGPPMLIDPSAPPIRVPRRPPVVMILMDEFPIDAMLGPDGRIDAVRYPNFAALADTGTWFKNASTVYDSTTKAIPEILDGRWPRDDVTPDFRGHPESVYTAFGGRGYHVIDSEEATSICPPRYCPRAPRGRPGILENLQGGRRERLERFFSRVAGARQPTLGVKHVLIPHGPYQYLPGGKQTRRSFRDPIPGMNSPPGFGDPFLTDHNQQRLLLQIGFADYELGKLFAKLRAAGILDKALIAVTADHGMAFEVGVKDRRTVTRSNIDEIGPVPLFIKAPGQRRGRTDLSYVRTIDIVPTIADILNFRLPYRHEGRSAFSRVMRRRHFVRLIKRDFSGTLTVSARAMESRRRANLRHKLRLFGSGDWRTLFTGIGPNRRLIGRAQADLHPAALGRVRATIKAARDLRAYNPRSSLQPSHIAGPVNGGGRGQHRDVAVAVNGRIEAVGRTFYLQGSSQEGFAVMVPPASLHPGRNTVEVYEVSGRGASVRLIGRV